MAGTCTQSAFLINGIRGINFVWESNSGGEVSNVTSITELTGVLESSLVYPSQASGYVPDSGFDCYMFNADSFDLFNALQINQTDAPKNFAKMHSLPNSTATLLVKETARLHIENAGNNRRGYVVITLK
jgi:hypothetical protein